MQPKDRICVVAPKSRLWFLAFLVLSAKLAFGQAPSGTFTFNFDTNTPLLDLTGGFQTSQTILGAGGTPIALVYGVDLTNAPTGRLRGSGVTIVQVGSDFFAAPYTASGSMSGGGTHPIRVSLLVRMSGEGTLGGQFTTFRIAVRYNLTFNTETGLLEGSAHGSANFAHVGSSPIRDDFISVELPSGVDGSWSAALTIVPLKRLGGQGIITLPNGRRLIGNLSGSFSGDLARVTLTGIDDSKGFTVRFTLSSSEEGVALETVRGKILGQTVIE